MKKVIFITLSIIFMALSLVGFSSFENASYKCQIKMKAYSGEGAYIVTSLMNPEGAYEQTLYVNGDDSDWYNEIYDWWDFYGKRRIKLDAITGETISGGQQKVIVFTLPKDKMDKGYHIKFETAVEDDDYHSADVEVEFTRDNLGKSIPGKGFIQSVRLIPQS